MASDRPLDRRGHEGRRSMIEQQLTEELQQRFAPMELLLGSDISGRLEQSAHRLAIQLNDPTDGPGAAAEILSLLDPGPEWWGTPLGVAVAKTADVGDRSLTQRAAAKALGVTPGTVAQLVHRGALPTDKDGHVLLSGMLKRLLK